MALEVPEGRKVHIARIFGTNKDGEILSDMYADVLRIDQMRSRTQREYNRIHRLPLWQTVTLRPRHWNDKEGFDGTEEEEELVETENRDFELLKLVPPDEDNPEDPEEWIPLRIPKRIKMNDSGFDNSRRFLILKEDADKPDARAVQAVRIHFYETSIDEDAEAAAEAGNKVFYVGPDDVPNYEKDPDTEDKETYIQYEIITRFRTRKGRSNADSDGSDQGLHFNLKNKFLIDDADGEAEDDKVYRPDPMQNFININWGGLAVEFEEGEYITLAETIPNHSKATGCMWFRIPSSSYESAKEDYDAWDSEEGPREPFVGIIPLMTMGPPVVEKQVESIPISGGSIGDVTILSWTGSRDYPDCSLPGEWVVSEVIPGVSLEGSILGFTGETNPVEPCCIGVDCSGDTPKLFINLVFDAGNPANIDGFRLSDGTADTPPMTFNQLTPNPCGGLEGYDRHGPGGCEGPCTYGVRDVQIEASFYDATTWLVQTKPEILRTVSVGGSIHGTAIELDRWHCLIFSYDLSRKVATTGIFTTGFNSCGGFSPGADPGEEGKRVRSASKLYVALDDEPKKRKELSEDWPRGYDPNGVLTVNGMLTALHQNSRDTTGPDDDCLGNIITATSDSGPAATYSFTPDPLPTSSGSMAFPAGEDYAEQIKRVEMGPFTMFLGVVANPDSLDVRRAFVTERGRPASITAAKKYFEKSPEIALRRVKHWQKAKNVGSLNTDPDQYGTVVGEIERYRPNPNLYDDQGE